MGEVKEIFVRYGQSTSVKGVSKAVKSTRWSLRVLWLIAFCFGTAVGLYQICYMLIKYYHYNTYTSISICNGCHPPFPDVTLCNLNPINLLDEFQDDILSLQDYLKILDSLTDVNETEMLNGSRNEEFLYDVYGWIYSLSGYFQNIFTLDIVAMLLQADYRKQLVQKCKWYDWDDNEYEPEMCEEMSKFHFFNEEFLMCTTLHLNESHIKYQNDKVKAVQAILFLNDFSEQIMPFYRPHIQRSESVGVRVYIHPHNTLPEVGRGFNIPIGHEVKISLKATKITSEPDPYSNCMKEKKALETGDVHTLAKEFEPWIVNYTYSETAAASVCKQERIIQICGCYSSILPFTFKMASKYPDVLGCNNLKFSDEVMNGTKPNTTSVKKVVENIECLYSKIDTVSLDAECAAYHECDKYQYDYQISQASWPHESYVLGFYCEVIREQSCEFQEKFRPNKLNKAFDVYENILELVDTNATLAWQKLSKLDLIKKNFIDLKLTFDHPQMIELLEKPAMTLGQLSGSLGGLFNLWIGITFFTLVELVDLCFVIATYSCPCGGGSNSSVGTKDIRIDAKSVSQNTARTHMNYSDKNEIQEMTRFSEGQ